MQAVRMRGFTLIELSVVVMVVALLLGSLLVPLTTQVEQRNVSETQKRLQEVRDALIGYAIVNGRFPCPAVSTGASTDTGTEAFAGGGTKSNGQCATFNNGFVPGATLGLSNLDSQGFVVDAWGLQQNRIRYAIADTTASGIQHLFTAFNGMRASAIINASGGGVTFLNVCSASPAGTAPFAGCANAQQTLSSEAVFIVYSVGKNAATGGGTSADEAANLDGDAVFVSRTNYSQAAGEYDDLMLWTSRPALVGQLAAAGQLP